KGPLLVSTKLALKVAAITSTVANLMGNLNEASPATVAQLATKSWFSIKKAEHILGWKPEISFDEGMQRSKKWASDNGLLDK
ncbi:MAG TPA: NAD(P)-dependent oxidoreductase, partial [Porticoccaceae bacterium]|nr:NAD(P)-dependent oxidoreductase [Porticoccaceae bacterium]